MNPDKVLEDPAGRGMLHPLAFVVGKRRLLRLERCAEAICEGGVHEQAHGHHHHQGHNAFRFCEIQGGGQKLGGFEEAQATLRVGLVFRVAQQVRGGQAGLVQFMRREEKTTLLVHEGRPGREGGREDSVDRGEGVRRWGARAWAAPRAIAWGRTYRTLVQEGGLEALRQRGQCLLRICGTGQGPTPEFLEGGDGALALCEPLLVDRMLRLGVAVLCVDQPPALGPPTRGRGQALRAIAWGQRGHGLGIRLGERGLRLTPRRRHTGDPLERGRGTLLEIVGILEGAIRHQRGGPIRRGPLGHRVFDHLAELAWITAMATEGLPQQGNARLVCDNQRQHDLLEVRAMIAPLALGDVHDRSRRLLITGVAPIDMKARTVEMGKTGCQGQPLGGGRRDQAVAFRHSVRLEGRQGSSQGIIIALCRAHAGRHQPSGGLMVEQTGDQIQGVVDKPQPLEDHRFDGLPDGEVPHCWVLLRCLIQNVTNAACIEHASDKAEVL